MIAIELSTGKIRWQKWIDSDVMSAPVAKGDELYAVTFSGSMYRFKQSTGEIVEAKSIRGTSAPVFDVAGEMIVSRRSDRVSDSSVSEVVVVGMGKTKKSVYRKTAHYLDPKVQEKAKYKNDAIVLDANNGFAGGAPSTANASAAYMNIGLSNVSALQAYQGSRALCVKDRLYNTLGDELVCTDRTGKLMWKKDLQGNLKEEGGSLGTLVGKTTWGGLVGVLGYPELLDGGVVTAPNVAFYDENGYGIENMGTPPDVEVEQWPSQVIQGHDPQLEKAIEIALQELKKNPPKQVPVPKFPVRVRK